MAKEAKKKLFRKCPSCKFAKCWDRAEECEQCGFNFKLGRKVRNRTVTIEKPEAISEDDEFAFLNDIDLKPKAPKETKKPCPECGHICWHAAQICENCEYDFLTKETRQIRVERDEKLQRKLEGKVASHESKGYSYPKTPSFFGGQSVIVAVALGGFGEKNRQQAQRVLAVKPPSGEKMSRNTMSQWIQRVQDFGLKQTGFPAAFEYSEGAISVIFGEHKKKYTPEQFEDGLHYINQIFGDLLLGIKLSFDDELEPDDIPEEPKESYVPRKRGKGASKKS
jgi:hypothetical protein